MAQARRSEFAQALAALASERGITPEVIIEQLKIAMIAAYRREMREHGEEIEEENLSAEINEESGEVSIFQEVDSKKNNVTPPGFTRIAAQTFRQIFRQKTREAEREAVLAIYEGRVGQLVSGVILRFDGQAARVDLGKAEAIVPPTERIPNERLSISQRLTFFLKEIREGVRGREIILSRADPEFVKKLFAREVPEIMSGSVEIHAIARDPGVRTKIAVVSRSSGVDPVGSCVGQKGVRVQAVINELGGEKIDVIPWSEDPIQLITAALAPAQDVSITTSSKEKKAKARVPEGQLPLAIGKDGQNVRLASRLTEYEIDVEGIKGPESPEEKKEKESKEEMPKDIEELPKAA